MIANKDNQTELVCKRISSAYNFSQQQYANFLHNQRLNKTASSSVVGGTTNQTDVSHINNNVVTTNPANLEDQTDFIEAIENDFIQFKSFNSPLFSHL